MSALLRMVVPRGTIARIELGVECEDVALEDPMKTLLRLMGLAPSARDQEIMQLVKGSYKSVRVVGRGTIKIDPKCLVPVFDGSDQS